MAKRLKIAISYNYNKGWIGGTYYIDNLVQALNTLDDAEKPILSIITGKKEYFDILKKVTSYPYLTYQISTGETSFFKKLVNTFLFRTINKRLFSRSIKNLDGVFPYYKSEQQDLAKTKVYWIADFQEHYLPHFFSEEEVIQRKEAQKAIANSTNVLLLSSQNACQHFKEIFPEHKVKIRVLPFAVTNKSKLNEVSQLIKKYNLPDRFFICCNQFWQHKNHMVILEALNYMKSNYNWNIPIVFTGNTGDYRNPGYYPSFLNYIEQNNLKTLTFSLGFVDRIDQLTLMNHALAIIQPSLFEGWSTVIEDAKSLNKMIIASSIDVHQEQLQHSNAKLFEHSDFKKLAYILKESLANDQKLFDVYNYSTKVGQFAKSFISIFK